MSIYQAIFLTTITDTYVKTYLRDDGKHSQKRKTRVVRRKLNPNYNQTLRYPGSEAVGKDLVVSQHILAFLHFPDHYADHLVRFR